MGYKEYLASPEWKELADKVKSRDKCCVLCGRTEQLEAHHRTYERIGVEELDDLVTVCNPCHVLFHAAVKVMAPPLGKYVKDFRWGPDARPATAEEVKGFMDSLREKLGWE
jgi:hypothetical protein